MNETRFTPGPWHNMGGGVGVTNGMELEAVCTFQRPTDDAFDIRRFNANAALRRIDRTTEPPHHQPCSTPDPVDHHPRLLDSGLVPGGPEPRHRAREDRAGVGADGVTGKGLKGPGSGGMVGAPVHLGSARLATGRKD